VKQGFSDRLAYARLLVHFRTGRCVSNTEIGAAVERTQPWVTKWAKSAKPPKDFEVHAPLAAFFAVDERWLMRGEGDPPEVELWERWQAGRDATLAKGLSAAKHKPEQKPDVQIRTRSHRENALPSSPKRQDGADRTDTSAHASQARPGKRRHG
jgi:hypothetical protein